MSAILSDTNATSSTFNAFHSFEGFAVLDIELPQNLNQENFGSDLEKSNQLTSLEVSHYADKYDSHDDIANPQEDSAPKSASQLFGKSKSIIEFFYTEEKEIIKLDSSIVTFDDYEIF